MAPNAVREPSARRLALGGTPRVKDAAIASVKNHPVSAATETFPPTSAPAAGICAPATLTRALGANNTPAGPTCRYNPLAGRSRSDAPPPTLLELSASVLESDCDGEVASGVL